MRPDRSGHARCTEIRGPRHSPVEGAATIAEERLHDPNAAALRRPPRRRAGSRFEPDGLAPEPGGARWAEWRYVGGELAPSLRDRIPKGPRKVLVAALGGGLVLVGVAMIFLPGPAILVIPAGLAVLASEYEWARRALEALKGALQRKKKGVAPVEAAHRA